MSQKKNRLSDTNGKDIEADSFVSDYSVYEKNHGEYTTSNIKRTESAGKIRPSKRSSSNDDLSADSPLSLTSLKGIKSGVFSDGNEHCFTTQELHLNNTDLANDLDDIVDEQPALKKEKKVLPPDKADIKYNPAMDTDVNFNKKASDYDVDSIFSVQQVPPARPKYSESDLHMSFADDRDNTQPPTYGYNSNKNYPPKSGKSKKKKKKSKKGLIIALCIIGVLLAAAVVVGVKAKSEINNFKAQAYELKDNLKETLSSVKTLDPDQIEKSLDNINKSTEKILDTLDEPFWKLVTIVPSAKDDVNSVRKLVDILDDAQSKIFVPLIDQLRTTPLSNIKTEEGFNTSVIVSYLDFFNEISPALDDVSSQFSDIEFKTIKINSFEEYSEKLKGYFSKFDIVKEYEPLLRALLGNGEDKYYLLMAQNSAEIRASGGFPGQMGTIVIQNGILKIGDFASIRDFIYSPILEESGITSHEYDLFGYMYATWAHDACYNMHFSRVAEITKVAFEYQHGIPIDGIISLTPVVIQRLLQISGQPITLADGTEITAENATQILQRDMYYKYQSDDSTAQDNDVYIDPLFAETAKKAMAILTEDFDYKKLPEYINFFEEGFKDRTMMIWFKDSEDEQASINAGCSGNLNSDPEKPVCGTYFSLSDPGKLGSFISIDPQIVSSKKLSDGSTEYSIQVDFTNTLTDEYKNAGTWILGNYGGAIQCFIYFTAPCGGTISDLVTNMGVDFTLTDYQGVQLYYAQNIYIQPGYPPTATFKVTTAPGVETPLVLEKTPTLQDYFN